MDQKEIKEKYFPMEDIKPPVSKCKCGHKEPAHFPNKLYSGHTLLVCLYCGYDSDKCYPFTPSIPQPEKGLHGSIRSYSMQSPRGAIEISYIPTQTPEWEKAYSKAFPMVSDIDTNRRGSGDDYATGYKNGHIAGVGLALAESYRISRAFISKLLEEKEQWWTAHANYLIQEAEQNGYERGKEIEKGRWEMWKKAMEEKARKQERQRIIEIIEQYFKGLIAVPFPEKTKEKIIKVIKD